MLYLENDNTQWLCSFSLPVYFEFYRVLSWLLWNISLIFAVGFGRKLTTLFIYWFFPSQNQRAKAGSMTFRSQNFHAMYLAGGSFVFAWDANQPKNNHVKELHIGIFLNESTFSGMFSFQAPKAPGIRDCSHQSRCFKSRTSFVLSSYCELYVLLRSVKYLILHGSRKSHSWKTVNHHREGIYTSFKLTLSALIEVYGPADRGGNLQFYLIRRVRVRIPLQQFFLALYLF